MKKKIGLLINPIAGLGGKAGFKGSDNLKHQQQAMEKGYQKCSARRAEECFHQIPDLADQVSFYAPAGEMGGAVLEKLNLPYQTIYAPKDSVTSVSDTLDVLQCFLDQQVDLILFCGGDGTARDVCGKIGLSLPVLGIPAGVKMYSGCFAVNPLAAGQLLRNFLLDTPLSSQMREVLDIEESVLGQPRVSPRLYGYLQMITDGQRLQGPKEASDHSSQEPELMAAYFSHTADPDTLYLIGPGSTTYKIKQQLCGDGTLIGVDAVKGGRLLVKDADEHTILDFLSHEKKAEIIVTCIGGAGFVFGRGNQQLSPAILRTVTKEHIRLAVTKSKLAGLKGHPMLVDTGDPDTDAYLSGYYKIAFNENESTVYPVSAPL